MFGSLKEALVAMVAVASVASFYFSSSVSTAIMADSARRSEVESIIRERRRASFEARMTTGRVTTQLTVKSVNARGRWTVEEAWEWQKNVGWLIGGNYVPAYAINQIEMFSDEGWNPAAIDKELHIASQKGGMNVMRVFLHNLLFEEDRDRYFYKLDQFLDIAGSHSIKTIFVFFDACWRATASTGPQPTPVPHTHNSGWVQCPTHKHLLDETHWQQLQSFVTETVLRFRGDSRVVMWDVYNEPSNTAMEFNHIPRKLKISDGAANLTMITEELKQRQVLRLLEKSFMWARAGSPSQPITSGIWGSMHPDDGSAFTTIQISYSDVISFHNYDAEKGLSEYIDRFLAVENRPLICTEYLARGHGSTIQSALPIFHSKGISAIHWGVFDGKTQTIYPWSSWHTELTARPSVWHHDIFLANGTAYDDEELLLMKKLRRDTIDWDAVKQARNAG